MRLGTVTLLGVALALGGSLACAAGADAPPQIEVDRTACAHCGMLISEPIYAAAYKAPDADARVFDDIACLLAAVSSTERGVMLRFWFQDAAGQGWIDGERAVFVKSPRLRTPMNGGIAAYRDRASAAKAATEHGGRVLEGLNELLESETKGGEL